MDAWVLVFLLACAGGATDVGRLARCWARRLAGLWQPGAAWGQKVGRPVAAWGGLGQLGARRSGGLWRPVAAWGSLGPEGRAACGALWRPVAACGSLRRPSRSPTEEDKMIRSMDSSILAPEILDSSCLGARRVGLLDFSCRATLACWTDVLFRTLLRGVGDERDWML